MVVPRLPAQLHDSSTEIPGSEIDCAVPVTEHQYAERIEQILDFIRAGDVYQLNFTIPLNVHATGSVASLYRRLHGVQPAPYSAFLHTQPSRHILSLSPELFFRVDEADTDPASMNKAGPTRRITTRPMKGTAARGRTTAEDRAQAQWLANDAKNRAENVMIVDLLRNDLGRLCNFGSVRVENLFAVERYPTLWQMTSTVTGELRPEAGFQDIFRALFPCGSVTGAPKIRAMQLLAELEERPRGVYTGAIGFFSKEQTVFNVAIRTLTLNGDAGTMGVGSGIVIDSEGCLGRVAGMPAESAGSSPALTAHEQCREASRWWRACSGGVDTRCLNCISTAWRIRQFISLCRSTAARPKRSSKSMPRNSHPLTRDIAKSACCSTRMAH